MSEGRMGGECQRRHLEITQSPSATYDRDMSMAKRKPSDKGALDQKQFNELSLKLECQNSLNRT